VNIKGQVFRAKKKKEMQGKEPVVAERKRRGYGRQRNLQKNPGKKKGIGKRRSAFDAGERIWD